MLKTSLLTFLLTATAFTNASTNFFFQTHYFQSEDPAFMNDAAANGSQAVVCDGSDNWKVTLLSRTPDCPSNDQCTPPNDFRINLDKAQLNISSITRVKALCNDQDPELKLPVTDERIAVVKFYNDNLCERNTWTAVYAIRTGNECMRNFLNDSVAEGTKDGFIKVTCPGAGIGNGRISFYQNAICTERIPSDIYSGPGYIDLNDKCFKGTNYIRAYCQEAVKVNDESTGEKIDRECKEDPNQLKCQKPTDNANGDISHFQIPNLMIMAIITFICSLLF